MATLVAGSYEKFIWGFQLKSQTLKPLFSFPSHLAPIKTVAVSGPVAVSGASDDAVKIYDLSSCSEVGSLTDHNGAVTSLSFFNPSPSLSFPRNLFSASDDGTVCIYDADPFVHLKTIVAHRRSGVSDLAVHPSGKLALTVGRDSCLAMLNLVRGRRSFYCRLDREASSVRFDREGLRFFMVSEEKVSVHESEDARLVCELENPKRVLCVAAGEKKTKGYMRMGELCLCTNSSSEIPAGILQLGFFRIRVRVLYGRKVMGQVEKGRAVLMHKR